MASTPTTFEIALRIGLAMVGGMLLGLERESHGRAAGFRTTLIVCIAAALAMVISELAFVQSVATSTSWRPDPMRLAAGLLAGMGFLGAGTIVRQGNIVRGVTTAATLWFSTIVGLAFGSGYFLVGSIGVATALFILIVLPVVEKHIDKDHYPKLIVTMELDALPEDQLKRRIEAFGVSIKWTELHYDLVKRQKKVSCELKLKQSMAFDLGRKLAADLAQHPGILSIEWT
jgi:putative Mg2+ transporter-C (MgtC) family protein